MKHKEGIHIEVNDQSQQNWVKTMDINFYKQSFVEFQKNCRTLRGSFS